MIVDAIVVRVEAGASQTAFGAVADAVAIAVSVAIVRSRIAAKVSRAIGVDWWRKCSAVTAARVETVDYAIAVNVGLAD